MSEIEEEQRHAVFEGSSPYPGVMQGPDGRIHTVHSHGREHVRHVVLDPEVVEAGRE